MSPAAWAFPQDTNDVLQDLVDECAAPPGMPYGRKRSVADCFWRLILSHTDQSMISGRSKPDRGCHPSVVKSNEKRLDTRCAKLVLGPNDQEGTCLSEMLSPSQESPCGLLLQK
jgi:hypothetical protein